MSILDNLKLQFKNGSELVRLLYINIGVFALIQLVLIITTIGSGGETNYWGSVFVNWLILPVEPISLLMKPWTIVTYMFAHQSFRHLIFNLIVLYFTGNVFQEYLGGKRLVTAYVGGGLAGGLLFFIISNLTTAFGPSAGLIGASAGVMAVLMALTIYVPNLPVKLFFVLDVKLWHVTVLFFLLDLSGIASLDNPGGRIAHIGGAAFGYLMILQLRKGTDFSLYLYALIDAIQKAFKPKPKLKTVYNKNKTKKSSFFKTSSKAQNSSKPKKPSNIKDNDRLNEILDKIKVTGYEGLSKEEKEFLFKQSKS